MRALATWCVRNRWKVILSWLAVLIWATVLGQVIGTKYSNDFSLPGTESTRALALLRVSSPNLAGDSEQIVFATSHGAKVTDAAMKQRIVTTLERIQRFNHVTQIVAPFAGGTTKNPFTVRDHQISADVTIAYATVTLNLAAFHVSTKFAKQFITVATAKPGANLNVAVAGQVAGQAKRPAVGGLVGAIAAGIVLLLVFGSFAAALMPLISALVALGTASALIGILSNIFTMPEFAPQLVLLIGLGVGVDYALFIVTRHRQGLIEGKDMESSIVQAVNTSGRAVMFAGIIVCIALLGMFALRVTFLSGLAIGASIGVAFTMLAALTLLPAILAFVGPYILSRRQRRRLVANGPRHNDDASLSFWAKWSNFVSKRPTVPALLALVLVGFIAAPFFSMRLGAADQGNDPVGTSTRTAYDELARGFGVGHNGPLQIVSQFQPTPANLTAIQKLVAQLALDPGVKSSFAAPPITSKPSGTGVVEIINVIPTTSPQDVRTTQLINRLRHTVVPTAISGTKLVVYVGGATAIFNDFAGVLASKMPLFIGLVVLTSFLLLAAVFRSLVVPLTSAVMNLISIGAAFGVLTAVFQWGWLGGLFGINRAGPIEAFLPVMMFAILFGLSMDYQVFLLVRMHEEWLKSGDNRTAIRLGLARTGKTITAAALIMIVVFGSFILGGERVIKEFGLGLAGGVLVDAIIIRMAIVPAVMFLFGKSNWWIPKWLDRWLPKFGLEHD